MCIGVFEKYKKRRKLPKSKNFDSTLAPSKFRQTCKSLLDRRWFYEFTDILFNKFMGWKNYLEAVADVLIERDACYFIIIIKSDMDKNPTSF